MSRGLAVLVIGLTVALAALPAQAQGYGMSVQRFVDCFASPNNPTEQARARDAVETLRAYGWSDADIVTALYLSERANVPVSQVAAMKMPQVAGVRAAGLGWDAIAARLGVESTTLLPGSPFPHDGGGFVSQPQYPLQVLNTMACSPH